MNKLYRLALHIFRRDLRLQDNSALLEALSLAEKVIPCFIFDKRQIENNVYKSDNAIQFMASSLQELDNSLLQKNAHLYCFYGITEEVVEVLLQQHSIEAIFINRDYTPFSKKRDAQIKKVCDKYNVSLHILADALLHEPEQVAKSDGTPYTLFTPFYKKASQLTVTSSKQNKHSNYYHKSIAHEDKHLLKKLSQKKNLNLAVKGGRKEGLNLLKHIQNLSGYAVIRNFPAENGTTKLSAHLKFGTISIRECYETIKQFFDISHALITELYWRDFFTHIAYHFPQVFKGSFRSEYNNLAWKHDEKIFRRWCEGRTGFPIVDAGMRELNITGYMHNRVRMITASFLVKDLHLNWQLGEKYFAQKLVDYDPSLNNGNWQWAASTGCDAVPYFRIFNPWLQQKKYDHDCIYIKRFIPELALIPSSIIHTLSLQKKPLMTNYETPIADHKLAASYAKRMFKLKA